ncbi:hypothetical protein LNI98_11895 [Tenacibaculum dicentrarchi]|uniref:hypothetical protein n=1 Tax=Tenacibaculum finnmarkense TaxID=2781243 RepID=UPI000C5A28C6|nr:hypothetical protein [Tenacibaculum finnmarkense]MCD8440961.1 hypothetical protein [Tenacibaculum finnmarkense genomovar ulcerans]MCD8450391.1 hypothetical protein [Tenacibaculum dicentrarchi]MCG8721876.1 hypothetical protein [Tenacibaculum finnmarkense]SOS55898.1 hypothetical protein TFHFJT_480002 [Tenacibaculum finnmarkense]
MERIQEIIYEHLCNEEINRNISIDKTKNISIDYKELNSCIIDTEERLKIKLKTGQCSKFLIEQLAIHRANYGEKFGDKIEFYNTSTILNLIENIEDNKCNGCEFTKDILKGYLHIHHSPFASIGYSIVRNVKEYWFINGKIRPSRIQDFEIIVKKYGTNRIDAIRIMMHQKTIGENNLKGEWLIYKKKNGKNYYLCLATHKEGDEFIFTNKILKGLDEFPELNN